MTTKRKPTLKQLFIAWKKHEKKCNEARKEKWKLESMAKEIGCSTELINDGEYVYRITVTNQFSFPYKVERIANTDELNNIK
jgi:hypothetical protein